MKKVLFHIKNEKGQGLVEYALIILIIAISMIVALNILHDNVQNLYDSIMDDWPAP